MAMLAKCFPGVDQIVESDVVIIGAGVAGLSTALGLAETAAVTVVTKTPLGEGGSSAWAQGGMAAAIGADDSPERHAADTLAVGDGLSDPLVVGLLTRAGPDRVRFLLQIGAQLDLDPGQQLALGREAGHSRNRIVHAHGDQTGAELVRALTQAVRTHPAVRIADRTFAIDLVVNRGSVVGVIGRGPEGQTTLWSTSAVVLATGGVGRIYARTTNPVEVTGDGLAMAARAGARLIDLEFMQFHPTALDSGRDPMPLLTEALRGEGAALVNERGERFLLGMHPAAELAPRDVVSRAIWQVLQDGGRVFLDGTQAPGERFPQRFPTVFATCLEHGIDPRHQRVPVSPAAHYHIGGVEVDARGRSSLPGLWAAGEDACTGVHGANRLASNSLLEAMVFAGEVARDIAEVGFAREGVVPRSSLTPPHGRMANISRAESAAAVDLELARQLRELMWQRVGLIRDEEGLLAALDGIGRLERKAGVVCGELRNMLDIARLMTRSALARRESRGVHYRADHPGHDTGAPYHVILVGETLEQELAKVA